MKRLLAVLLLSIVRHAPIYEQTIVGTWKDKTAYNHVSYTFFANGEFKTSADDDSSRGLGREPIKWRYTWDTTKSPAFIDLIGPSRKSGEVRVMRGLIQFEPDSTMRLIYNRKGGRRPKNFRRLTYDYEWHTLCRIY